MYRNLIKRIIDVIISFLGIIVLSPVLIVLSIVIKATSPGPVLFKQERVGKNNKSFKIYKFRRLMSIRLL